MTPDDALLQRCLKGEAGAWDEFVRRYQETVSGAVRHTFLRLTGRVSASDVENVGQEVFLNLYKDSFRRLRTFRGRASLAGWLRVLATNQAINQIRDEGLRKGVPLDHEPLHVGESEAEPPEAQEVRRISALMQQLKPRDRLVLKLHYLDGLPQKQIALFLGVEENTVWPLVSRARQRLRDLAKK